MATNWKAKFSAEQLAIIAEHTIEKTNKSSISSWAAAAEEPEPTLKWSRSDESSAHPSGKWMRLQDKRSSVPDGSSISIGCAGKVGGQALSTSPISSGTAAKVGMVDKAESHAESHGSAAPTAGGVVASMRNSLMLLGQQGEEMIEAAQKTRVAHLTKLG